MQTDKDREEQQLLKKLVGACEADEKMESGIIIEACSHENELIAWYACKAIGVQQDVDGIEQLMKVLSEPAQSFGEDMSDKRLVAAWSIAKFGYEKVGAKLTAATKADSELLRIGAVDALGEIGDPRAIEHLVQAILSDTYEVALWASLAAAKMGEIGLPNLETALDQVSCGKKIILIEDAIRKIQGRRFA